jgi:hypothetical protein
VDTNDPYNDILLRQIPISKHTPHTAWEGREGARWKSSCPEQLNSVLCSGTTVCCAL